MDVPVIYEAVTVLIIHWSRELDHDSGADKEITELEQLFEDSLNYHTKTVVLHNHSDPQAQTDDEVARFAEQHDGHHRNTLLIVYYSGHGILDRRNDADGGELIISGKQSERDPVDTGTFFPEAKWAQAEIALNNAQADCLLILDCCFAGSVMSAKLGHQTRSYEVLAACGRTQDTPMPGPRSFTRAMIDCLKDVLKRENEEHRRISTFDLIQMIVRQRDCTRSHLYNRLHGPTTRHIVLAPLESEHSEHELDGKKSPSSMCDDTKAFTPAHHMHPVVI